MMLHDATHEVGVEVRLHAQVIHKRGCFKFLGSLTQGEINNDVTHRIGARWVKWRLAAGVLYDKKVLPKIKRKFCRVVVRPTMLYGTKCWLVKNSHVQKIKIAEMRMLTWMYRHTRRDKIKNEDIGDKVGMASVMDKMREARLRWFGHMKRRSVDAPVKKCGRLTMAGIRRERGWPKK